MYCLCFLHKVLPQVSLPKIALYFPAKECWPPEKLTKANLLVLELIQKKVLMIDHLIKKSWTMAGRKIWAKHFSPTNHEEAFNIWFLAVFLSWD